MDTNSDSTVSQTEMEACIQNKGVTQDVADNLYAALTQNGATGLPEAQLAAHPTPPSWGPERVGGHRGHHNHRASSMDAADALLQRLHADNNGAVDQSELQSFVKANGGTTDQTNSIFASLDSASARSIGSADFTSAIEKLQGNVTSGSYSPMMMILNAMADSQSASAGSVSVSA